MKTKRLLIIEPFFTGSHKQWAENLVRVHDGEARVLSMKGRHWKWRMHGAAVHLAEQYQILDWKPELIIASDMLDISTFLGLVGSAVDGCQVHVYFHENQLTYPWSPTDADKRMKRDNHYAFINYTSALAADKVLFNSQYHLDSFTGALPDFLGQFPDNQGQHTIARIQEKSELSYMKLNLEHLIDLKKEESGIPTILWNHRWEYDKNPEQFFRVLIDLQNEGVAFKLIVTGRSYAHSPNIFSKAYKQLSDRISHWGYCESKEEYHALLGQADLLPVCSNQDFFGISIVEAIAAGVRPLLPLRLAYPELISGEQYFYTPDEDFKERLRTLLRELEPLPYAEREEIHRRFGA